MTVEMREFGELQTAAGWAAFTGLAVLQPSQEERALAIIVEQADPLLRGTRHPSRSGSMA